MNFILQSSRISKTISNIDQIFIKYGKIPAYINGMNAVKKFEISTAPNSTIIIREWRTLTWQTLYGYASYTKSKISPSPIHCVCAHCTRFVYSSIVHAIEIRHASFLAHRIKTRYGMANDNTKQVNKNWQQHTQRNKLKRRQKKRKYLYVLIECAEMRKSHQTVELADSVDMINKKECVTYEIHIVVDLCIRHEQEKERNGKKKKEKREVPSIDLLRCVPVHCVTKRGEKETGKACSRKCNNFQQYLNT